MALRKQDFEVTTSLPTAAPTKFAGQSRESVIRYSNRPAWLLGFELSDDLLTGTFAGFCVREVDVIDDPTGNGTDADASGRVLFNYVPHALDASGNQGPVFLFAAESVAVDGTTVGEGPPVLFNSKKLEVEVFGGGAATDTVTVTLYYESAGDYRF